MEASPADLVKLEPQGELNLSPAHTASIESKLAVEAILARGDSEASPTSENANETV